MKAPVGHRKAKRGSREGYSLGEHSLQRQLYS
jgi:hypothetical protein